jgi:uncharacterized integral membrane protein
MKTIKYLLWLIILVLLGILIYQNLDYFMTTTVLRFDLKVASWNWSLPELQNIAFFGICFLLGLILAGIKGFIVKFQLKKEVKTKDASITSLKEQVNTLKTELEVFRHDPYIKKELKENSIIEKPAGAQAENNTKKGDKSDTAD